MGIYDNPFETIIKSVTIDPKKWGKVIAAILLLIILAALGYWIHALSQPQAIQASFDPNPFSIGKDSAAILKVSLTNILPDTAQNVQLSIQTNSKDILITPKTQMIDFLGSQETRKLEIVVNPADPESKRFLPGTYSFEIQVVMNNQYFHKTIQLEVRE